MRTLKRDTLGRIIGGPLAGVKCAVIRRTRTSGGLVVTLLEPHGTAWKPGDTVQLDPGDFIAIGDS